MELLDEVDENNILTGRVLDKDYMHNNKIFHREVAAIIINEENELLIQKRAPTKKQCPNMWGLTAGHVDSGEKVENAMVREIKEELGININESKMKFLGTYKRESLHNCCFTYCFLVSTNKTIADMTMQKEEVSELKYITLEKLKESMNSCPSDYTFQSVKIIENCIKEITGG